MTTIVWRRLAAMTMLLLAGALSTARAAAFLPTNTGTSEVLIVSTGDAHRAALDGVVAALAADYGFDAGRVVRLRDGEASADNIERALFERLQRLQARDQVVVILALALHAKGEDRVIVTGDFDPARPWTGLPSAALRKLVGVGAAGTLVVFHPACATRAYGRGYALGPDGAAEAVQSANAKMAPRVSSGDGGATLIGWCGESPAATDAFLRDLAAALEEMAREPASRAPWQDSSERGLVGVSELTARLAERDRARPLAVEPAAAGWLRVAAPRGRDSVVSPTLLALRQATSTDALRETLSTLIAAVRNNDDPAETTRSEATLATYALDDAVDVPRRVLAVQALGDLDAATARAALERVFAGTRDSVLRSTALAEWQSLAKGMEPSLLRRALSDGDFNVQIAAIQLLAAAGDTVSRPALEALSRDAGVALVRAAAMRALAQLAEPASSRDALIAGLRDPNAGVREEAARSLGRLPPDATTAAALQTALADVDTGTSEAAAYAIAQHWPALSPPAANALAAALLDRAVNANAERARTGALWALARGNRRETASGVAALLAPPPSASAVRLAAIEALATFADPATVPALVGIASGRDDTADAKERASAIQALGHIDDARAVDALLAIATDAQEFSAPAIAALSGLRTATPRARAIAADDEVTAVYPPALRLATIDLLGRSGTTASADTLVRLLRAPDQAVRLRAASALAGHANARTIAALAALLDDRGAQAPADSVRIAAITALGAMRGAAANAELLRHVRDPSNVVRGAVAAGLDPGTLARADVPRLAPLWSDSDAAVRRATALLLRDLPHPEATAALQRLADDSDADVRAAAITALREAGQRDGATPAPEGDTVYRATPRIGQRAITIDVFWCAGGASGEARRVRAQKFAEDLRAYATQWRGSDDTIGVVRLRALDEKLNLQSGYRLTRDEIRFERGDARERAWAERLQQRWPAQFVAYPVSYRTADYVSVFICGGR